MSSVAIWIIGTITFVALAMLCFFISQWGALCRFKQLGFYRTEAECQVACEAINACVNEIAGVV